jgi:hypothetical protein
MMVTDTNWPDIRPFSIFGIRPVTGYKKAGLLEALSSFSNKKDK